MCGSTFKGIYDFKEQSKVLEKVNGTVYYKNCGLFIWAIG